MITFIKKPAHGIAILAPLMSVDDRSLVDVAVKAFGFILPFGERITGTGFAKLIESFSISDEARVVASTLKRLERLVPSMVHYVCADDSGVSGEYKHEYNRMCTYLVEQADDMFRSGFKNGYLFSFELDGKKAVALAFGDDEKSAYGAVSHLTNMNRPSDMHSTYVNAQINGFMDKRRMLATLSDNFKILPSINYPNS